MLAANAVLHSLLTDPSIQNFRSDYGTEGSKEVVLQNGNAHWPTGHFASLAGYEVQYGWRPLPSNQDRDRVLGFRLEAFEPESKADVRVTIWNAGGARNGLTIGGCSVRLRIFQQDDVWKTEVIEVFDP
jgi:hypothetical protein